MACDMLRGGRRLASSCGGGSTRRPTTSVARRRLDEEADGEAGHGEQEGNRQRRGEHSRRAAEIFFGDGSIRRSC
jgi:hypothetical protein